MINISQYTINQILAFGLIFLRIVSFLGTAGFFSSVSINNSAKILFSLILASLALSISNLPPNMHLDQMGSDILFFAIREATVGLILGMVSRFFFFVVSMASELISSSLGLSAAQIFNPASGMQSSVFDQFYSWIALLIFLVLNGHHIFVSGVVQSFQLLPIGSFELKVSYFGFLIAQWNVFFMIVVKLASPVIVAIFLSNLAIGVLGRAVPQVNVLVTSFPVSALLGIIILIITLPFWTMQLDQLLDLNAQQILKLIKDI